MRIDNQRLSLQEHQINVDLFLNTIFMLFINQPVPSQSISSIQSSIYFMFNQTFDLFLFLLTAYISYFYYI